LAGVSIIILNQAMEEDKRSQYESGSGPGSEGKRAAGFEAVVPNPKLKLMDQVREVMRLTHYASRTRGMKSPLDSL
jgi:hypothetical protein